MNDYKCPHTGFKKSCSSIRDSCPKWVHLIGINPNTGQPVEEFDCADHWIPILLVENAQKTNQVGAAIESFRNEMLIQGQMALSMDGEKLPEIEKPRN